MDLKLILKFNLLSLKDLNTGSNANRRTLVNKLVAPYKSFVIADASETMLNLIRKHAFFTLKQAIRYNLTEYL